jgi:hypothetical protein
VIVLTFNPGGTDNYRRIHLYPLPPGVGNVTNQVPQSVTHWRGTLSGGNVNWTSSVVNPAWITARVSTSGAAAPLKSWNVELQIPLTNNAAADGINLPTSGDFDFFAAILRVDSKGTADPADDTASPYLWPSSATPPDVWDIEMTTPAPGTWGKANLGGTGCGGVSFTVGDVRTNNNPTSLINLNGPNVFSVNLHNTSVDPANNPIPASQVRATFKIANFGIVDPNFGSWQIVPAPSNPTATQAIPASGNATLSTGAWNLTPAQRTQYTANRHQCIYVELDAVVPAGSTPVNFINRSAYRNMDFGTASVFERTATIDTRGLERLVVGGRKVRRVELVASPTVRERRVRTPKGIQLMEEMNVLYHGYLPTGRTIRIRQKPYPVLQAISSYGYTIRHTRPVIVRPPIDRPDVIRPDRDIVRPDRDIVRPDREPIRPEPRPRPELDRPLPPGAVRPPPPPGEAAQAPGPQPAPEAAPTEAIPTEAEVLATPAPAPAQPEESIVGKSWTIDTRVEAPPTQARKLAKPLPLKPRALIAPPREAPKAPTAQAIVLDIPAEGVVQLVTRTEYAEPPEEPQRPEQPRPQQPK